MSAPYQAAHARERTRRIPLPVLFRRLRTALLLQKHGSKAMAAVPHEPFPDLLWPGHCNIDWLELDDPVHRRARKARKPGTDLAAKAGWR